MELKFEAEQFVRLCQLLCQPQRDPSTCTPGWRHQPEQWGEDSRKHTVRSSDSRQGESKECEQRRELWHSSVPKATSSLQCPRLAGGAGSAELSLSSEPWDLAQRLKWISSYKIMKDHAGLTFILCQDL